VYLKDFHTIRPQYETTQQEGIEWFVAAHIAAERAKGLSEQALACFSQEIRERIERLSCKPDRIAKRGHTLADFLKKDWREMEIFRLHEMPAGLGLKERSDFYKSQVDPLFEQFYTDAAAIPEDLIHVTCTGYQSPSGAQKIVAKKNWPTTVTHAYHMGCYGSLPAIRMGMGFLEYEPRKKQCDIVHTEICCIHSNPSQHEADQIVTQSLFADGFIKYSIGKKEERCCLQVLSIQEELIPDSAHAMTWELSNWNFAMTLAKEVPVLIARALPLFLQRLLGKDSTGETFFAIHPGGPKIITQIQERLGLQGWQIAHSLEILKQCGNMSSATLPHIWQAMLLDPAVKPGSPIVSIAFGPGLCIAGAKMVKKCGS